jgi:hypothetical protein
MTNGALGAETGEMSTAGAPVAQPAESRHSGLWTRQLPFGLVLILTVLGVAYTSFSRRPIVAYWELLVPVIAIVCIGSGWQNAKDRAAQLRLIRTQALHWLAFLLVMNMMLLPGVQPAFNAGATALAIFTLLALGTFTAGIHSPCVANLPPGPDHGAWHSDACVDREFGFARRADRSSGVGYRSGILVAWA